MNPLEFTLPGDDELLSFFGAGPVERSIDDGYWCYEVASNEGMVVRFSVLVPERSVQTEIRLGASVVATVSHENATRLTIDQQQLRCEFLCAGCRATMLIDAARGYRIAWSSLRTQ